MSELRVAIVEDSQMLCEMLAEMLEDIDNVNVAATAAGQSQALETLAEHQVDLVIVDLELKEGNGLDVLRAIVSEPQRYGRPKAVVFSNYAVSSMSRRCRDLGVDGIFDKSFQLPDLISFVRQEVATH